MGRLRHLALLGLAACQPAYRSAGDACGAPEEGAIYVGPTCDAVYVPDGEGRGSDTVLANAAFRAVLRHPTASITRPGVGGGTVVDVAAWGSGDTVQEIIPIVGGGALDVDEWTLEADGIRAAGEIVPLPDQPVAGGRGEFRWTIDPVLPLLTVEGADGLWIHPRGATSVLDGWIWANDAVIGHDGEATSLGGALRTTATRVWVGTPATAWEAPWIEGIPLSGTTDGSAVAVYRDGGRIGALPVTEGSFGAVVPSDATAVRATRAGQAPSAWAAPAEDLELDVGGGGTVRVIPEDPEAIGWIALADARGQRGGALLPPGGATVALGEGEWTLDLTGGPDRDPVSLTTAVVDLAEQTIGVSWKPAFDRGERVLAAIGIAGERSWDWHGTDADALRLAAGRGVGFAVVAPRDDVATAIGYGSDAGRIRYRSGSRLEGDGFSILSWPWTASPRRGGHGAPDPAGLSRSDALALVHSGVESSRFTAVDLGWLELDPQDADPRPELVLLARPADPAVDWKRWFDWLDAWVPLVPVSGATWVDVPDHRYYAEEDVEAAIIRGHVCAGSGPLLTVTVGGVGPGEASEGGAISVTAVGPVEHVAVYSRGGETLARWDDVTTPFSAEIPGPGDRWVVAAAWSGSEWAATGPVWVGPGPGQ